MQVTAYQLVKGNFKELSAIVEKGMLPYIRRAPGFVDYGLVDAGPNSVVEVSIWETRRAAQKPIRAAANWISENIGDRIRLVKSYFGDLALSRSVHVRGLGEALREQAAVIETPKRRKHAA